VRAAYTRDRDAWIALRRDVDAGKTPTAAVLAAQQKAFAGWARAFQAAARARPTAARAKPTTAVAPRVVPPEPGGTGTEVAAPPSPPAMATASASSGAGAGAAVAGGLVLAGIIAVAAKRRRP
jgi:hypothetical protein